MDWLHLKYIVFRKILQEIHEANDMASFKMSFTINLPFKVEQHFVSACEGSDGQEMNIFYNDDVLDAPTLMLNLDLIAADKLCHASSKVMKRCNAKMSPAVRKNYMENLGLGTVSSPPQPMSVASRIDYQPPSSVASSNDHGPYETPP